MERNFSTVGLQQITSSPVDYSKVDFANFQKTLSCPALVLREPPPLHIVLSTCWPQVQQVSRGSPWSAMTG